MIPEEKVRSIIQVANLYDSDTTEVAIKGSPSELMAMLSCAVRSISKHTRLTTGQVVAALSAYFVEVEKRKKVKKVNERMVSVIDTLGRWN